MNWLWRAIVDDLTTPPVLIGAVVAAGFALLLLAAGVNAAFDWLIGLFRRKK